MYYHIPKNGGTTVESFLSVKRKGVKNVNCPSNNAKGPIGSRWINCVEEVDKYISVKNKRHWITISLHNGTPGMHWLKHNISRWKKDLQTQKCNFLTAINFREPISRVKSLIFYTGVKQQNLTKWVQDYGEGKNTNNQIEYLLWNWYSRNQSVPMKLKEYDEKRSLTAMDITEFWKIIEIFDIVGFTKDLDNFMNKIERAMNWKRLHKKHINVTPKKDKYLITDNQNELIRCATDTESKIYENLNLMFKL